MRKRLSRLSTLIGILALVAITTGAAMIEPALGFITAGLALGFISWRLYELTAPAEQD